MEQLHDVERIIMFLFLVMLCSFKYCCRM